MKKLRLLFEEAEEAKKKEDEAKAEEPQAVNPTDQNEPVEEPAPEEETTPPETDVNPADSAANSLEFDKLKKYIIQQLEGANAMDDAIMVIIKAIGDAVDKDPTKVTKKNDVLYYMNLLRRKIYNTNLGQ